MVVIGLDGCPGGWVVAVIRGKERELKFIETLDKLLDMRFKRAAIDMPIGLPANWYRHCDLSARQMLDKNRSRVFLGARRCVIEKKFKTAKRLNLMLHARNEAGISEQLWNLRKKLREVDTYVTKNQKVDLREAHPELVFQRLNGRQPVEAKKGQNRKHGIEKRIDLLRENGFPKIDDLLVQPRKLNAKLDDILDACAAAIAARDFGKKYVLPRGYVPRDDKDLPMQIWY